MDTIDHVAALFARHGHRVLGSRLPDPVTLLDHSLQCAHLAQQAAADASLVAAALLHDLGHLMALADVRPRPVHDADVSHADRGAQRLQQLFGPGVTEPIRLHVQAKRYLVGLDPGYKARLSPASMDSLMRQGGPLAADERAAFEALAFADAAVALRRWDDQARMPGRHTPPLAHYLTLLRSVATRQVLLRHAARYRQGTGGADRPSGSDGAAVQATDGHGRRPGP